MDRKQNDVQGSYDQVAQEYTEKCLHEFDHKPLDRALMDRFAKAVSGKGRVLDLGCGPGEVAVYLKAQGLDVLGIDLSTGMVEAARRANPDIEFRQGDMRQLDLPDQVLAGIVAFYSIIHIPPAEVTSVLQELRRVLKPNGLLLLAFHAGDELRHVEEFFGKSVSLDFQFYRREDMEGYLRAARFVIEDVVERGPYPDVEAQTDRVYIFARKSEG